MQTLKSMNLSVDKKPAACSLLLLLFAGECSTVFTSPSIVPNVLLFVFEETSLMQHTEKY